MMAFFRSGRDLFDLSLKRIFFSIFCSSRIMNLYNGIESIRSFQVMRGNYFMSGNFQGITDSDVTFSEGRKADVEFVYVDVLVKGVFRVEPVGYIQAGKSNVRVPDSGLLDSWMDDSFFVYYDGMIGDAAVHIQLLG